MARVVAFLRKHGRADIEDIQRAGELKSRASAHVMALKLVKRGLATHGERGVYLAAGSDTTQPATRVRRLIAELRALSTDHRDSADCIERFCAFLERGLAA
jgi:hypothetical protein